jgi:hypothetical protein
MHILLNLALLFVLGMGAYDYFGVEYKNEIIMVVAFGVLAAVVEAFEQ